MNENAVEEQTTPLAHTKLARLTTDIVVAYVSKNAIAAAELPEAIGIVVGSLKALGGKPSQAAPGKSEPAVPVRRSVTSNEITCLVCGKRQKMLKRHLAGVHNLSPSEYRELFGLKPDYPMVAPSYTAQRSELARRMGLGRK